MSLRNAQQFVCPPHSSSLEPPGSQDNQEEDPRLMLARMLLEWLPTSTSLSQGLPVIRETAHQCKMLVTIKEAARLLSVSERLLRGRIARGAWPCYRAGRAVRVNPAELLAYMARPPRRKPR